MPSFTLGGDNHANINITLTPDQTHYLLRQMLAAMGLRGTDDVQVRVHVDATGASLRIPAVNAVVPGTLVSGAAWCVDQPAASVDVNARYCVRCVDHLTTEDTRRTGLCASCDPDADEPAEVMPTCDICHLGEGQVNGEWNGDTGCHIVCEMRAEEIHREAMEAMADDAEALYARAMGRA